MSELTLSISIDSSSTNGNPTSWQWIVDGSVSTSNPPPRMSVNDTFNVMVTDSNTSNLVPLDGYMIMGPKVENPLTGISGKGSPLKRGNAAGGNPVCVATWAGVAGGQNQNASNVYEFDPPSNVLLESGAWEVTVVISRSDSLATQFELDPEFDIGN